MRGLGQAGGTGETAGDIQALYLTTCYIQPFRFFCNNIPEEDNYPESELGSLMLDVQG